MKYIVIIIFVGEESVFAFYPPTWPPYQVGQTLWLEIATEDNPFPGLKQYTIKGIQHRVSQDVLLGGLEINARMEVHLEVA